MCRYNANLLKYPFLKKLNLKENVVNKLSISLDNIVKGNDNVLLSPLGERNDPKIILEKFDSEFLPKLTNLDDKILYELELSQRGKYGPRSISLPWKDRKENLFNYFTPENVTSKDLSTRPDRSTDFNILRPVSIENAINNLKNSTNSGLPYLGKKIQYKSEYMAKSIDELVKEDIQPAVLFTRTQEAKKTRDVWGIPMALSVIESSYFQPLLNYQKKINWRSALNGPEKVDESITDLLSRSSVDNLKLVSLDLSSYDSTCKTYLQSCAFDYIRYLYQKNYHPYLNHIESRFNKIGIVTPDGILEGSHGVPSGSFFTNEVDSIILKLTASNMNTVPSEQLQIQGDDLAACLTQSKLNQFYKNFEEKGLVVNYSKSFESDNYLMYLQRYYNLRYKVGYDKPVGGIYPIYRALERIIYREKWAEIEDYDLNGKDFYSITTISIMENCKHHPLFEDFVKFVYKYDKHKLEYSLTGLKNMIEYSKQTSGVSGLLINQYGDKLSGIDNFETIKIIKELK